MRPVRLLLATLVLAAPAAAECTGPNLFATLPPDRLAEIEAATSAQPYSTGNYWRATRGDEVITLIGTYHFDDPRHFPMLEVITPEIAAATTVLVEAGPEEERQLLDLIGRDPSKIMIMEGPTLLQTLPPETWSALSEALTLRGVPGFMAAKFRPWYITVLLAIPPCAMATMNDPKGLDGLVIDTAQAAGVPVRGLEPFDTVFGIFDAMTEAEQITLIQSTLALENQSAAYFVTMADGYFSGESRKIWELMRITSYDLPGYTRAEVDAEYARFEELLMASRNRAWISVLLDAAAEGPVFAAFGALHLSGLEGVLALLEAEGFTLTPLPL
ncbi:MAG: TraB/GumN family protein [Rhodobacterales bacterium 32-66-7]|nr:MAG: TraB/GumN family protein [Rhodobacterales bacterium 12-65-15]OYX24231.1 MAG: TraB/GumN family protein [Rhodobacterales bacterium 32-66-7]